MATRMNFSVILGTIFCIWAVSASRVARNSKKLKVTTISEPPYVIEEVGGTGNDKFRGFIPDMMSKLAEKLDLEYEMVKVADGKYGKDTGTGNWNGMIGEVQSKKVDMAAAPMTISHAREQVVDFTVPFMNIETTFLALKPADGEELTFTDAQSLADQTDIKYGVVKDGMTQNFFKESSNPTYRKMWEQMSSDSTANVRNNEEGVEKVRNSKGKFVFIIESSTAEYWINKTPCNLMKISKVDGITNRYGFVLPKGSDKTSDFSRAITEMKDSGEIDRLKEKWWKGDCSSSSASLTTLPAIMLSSAVLLLTKWI